MKYPIVYLFFSFYVLVSCKPNTTKEPTLPPSSFQSGWMPQEYSPKDPTILMLTDSALQLQTAALMDPTMEAPIRVTKLNEAFEILTAVKEQDPNYGLVYSNLAAIYLEKGDTIEAINMMKARLKIEPELAEGWQAMGFFHDKQGDSTNAFLYYKKSISHFDKRINMGKNYRNPQDIIYYYDNMAGRAYSVLLLGQTAEAHAAVRNLLEEAGHLLGENAGVYAAMLKMNRWVMLEQ